MLKFVVPSTGEGRPKMAAGESAWTPPVVLAALEDEAVEVVRAA